MKKKGFTLIELLVVIVILAVIALIAVPTVLNIIEDARKSSAEASSRNIVEAAETLYIKNILKQKPNSSIDLSTNTLMYDGTKATKGILNYTEDGNAYGEMYISGYCIEIKEDGTVISEKVNSSNCDIKSVSFISMEEYGFQKNTFLGNQDLKILILSGIEDNTKFYQLKTGTQLYYSSKYNAHVCFVNNSMTADEVLNGIKTIEGKTPTIIKYDGDINFSGNVNSADAGIINDSISSYKTISALQAFEMDVNGDKTVNSDDVTRVLQITVGL